MKSTFSSASRPSVLLDEVRGAGHMHAGGGRLSPPSLDLKPPRGMEGQGMFTVRSIRIYNRLFTQLSINTFVCRPLHHPPLAVVRCPHMTMIPPISRSGRLM
jgi:hypothetical protein